MNFVFVLLLLLLLFTDASNGTSLPNPSCATNTYGIGCASSCLPLQPNTVCDNTVWSVGLVCSSSSYVPTLNIRTGGCVPLSQAPFIDSTALVSIHSPNNPTPSTAAASPRRTLGTRIRPTYDGLITSIRWYINSNDPLPSTGFRPIGIVYWDTTSSTYINTISSTVATATPSSPGAWVSSSTILYVTAGVEYTVYVDHSPGSLSYDAPGYIGSALNNTHGLQYLSTVEVQSGEVSVYAGLPIYTNPLCWSSTDGATIPTYTYSVTPNFNFYNGFNVIAPSETRIDSTVTAYTASIFNTFLGVGNVVRYTRNGFVTSLWFWKHPCMLTDRSTNIYFVRLGTTDGVLSLAKEQAWTFTQLASGVIAANDYTFGWRSVTLNTPVPVYTGIAYMIWYDYYQSSSSGCTTTQCNGLTGCSSTTAAQYTLAIYSTNGNLAPVTTPITTSTKVWWSAVSSHVVHMDNMIASCGGVRCTSSQLTSATSSSGGGAPGAAVIYIAFIDAEFHDQVVPASGYCAPTNYDIFVDVEYSAGVCQSNTRLNGTTCGNQCVDSTKYGATCTSSCSLSVFSPNTKCDTGFTTSTGGLSCTDNSFLVSNDTTGLTSYSFNTASFNANLGQASNVYTSVGTVFTTNAIGGVVTSFRYYRTTGSGTTVQLVRRVGTGTDAASSFVIVSSLTYSGSAVGVVTVIPPSPIVLLASTEYMVWVDIISGVIPKSTTNTYIQTFGLTYVQNAYFIHASGTSTGPALPPIQTATITCARSGTAYCADIGGTGAAGSIASSNFLIDVVFTPFGCLTTNCTSSPISNSSITCINTLSGGTCTTCAPNYVASGTQTCTNGVWTGNLQCAEPCPIYPNVTNVSPSCSNTISGAKCTSCTSDYYANGTQTCTNGVWSGNLTCSPRCVVPIGLTDRVMCNNSIISCISPLYTLINWNAGVPICQPSTDLNEFRLDVVSYGNNIAYLLPCPVNYINLYVGAEPFRKWCKPLVNMFSYTIAGMVFESSSVLTSSSSGKFKGYILNRPYTIRQSSCVLFDPSRVNPTASDGLLYTPNTNRSKVWAELTLNSTFYLTGLRFLDSYEIEPGLVASVQVVTNQYDIGAGQTSPCDDVSSLEPDPADPTLWPERARFFSKAITDTNAFVYDSGINGLQSRCMFNFSLNTTTQLCQLCPIGTLYNSQTFVCVGNPCSTIPPVSNVDTSCTNVLSGGICSSCTSGYTATGSQVCINGAWSGAMACLANPCLTPPPIGNVNVSCAGLPSGSSCTTCLNSSYVNTGGSSVCSLGSWIGSYSCGAVSCPLAPPIFGVNTTTCGSTVSGGVCSTCLSNFTRTGSHVCSYGVWSGNLNCAAPCNSLPPIVGVASNCTNKQNGTVCSSCASTYTASGSQICVNGTWGSGNLVCALSCVSPPPTVFGVSASCAGTLSGNTCSSCLSNYVASGKQTCSFGVWSGNLTCVAPCIGSEAGPNTNCTQTPSGQSCSTCSTGYTLSSGSQNCFNGTWIGAMNCRANPCVNAPIGIFGINETACLNTPSGGSCTSCKSNYTSSGSQTCSLGTWSGNLTCSAPCLTGPTVVINVASHMCDFMPSGGSCISCQDGYIATGSHSCINGTWSGTLACSTNPCTTVPSIVGSDCVPGVTGSTCTTCLSGYTASGTETCNLGVWGGNLACIPRCVSSPHITGVDPTCSDIPNGGVCDTCSNGYTRSGVDTCNLGTWTGNLACTPKCMTAPIVSNVDPTCINIPSGTVCNNCLSGYTASGVETCSNGTWTGNLVCSPNSCSTLPSISNVNSSCINTASGGKCNTCATTNYVASGEQTCSLGVWSGNLTCLVPCPANPTAASNCNTTTKSGGSCSSCVSGYTPSGNQVCTNGTWSGNLVCGANSCTGVPPVVGTNCTGGALSGSVCTTCGSGYTALGAETCNAGLWSGNLVCIENSCEQPPSVIGVDANVCSLLTSGASCTNCMDGYTHTGVDVCDKGIWLGDLVCHENGCAGVPNINSNCSSKASGDVCETCADGYDSTGADTCIRGVWSGNLTCTTSVVCVDPNRVLNSVTQTCDCVAPLVDVNNACIPYWTPPPVNTTTTNTTQAVVVFTFAFDFAQISLDLSGFKSQLLAEMTLIVGIPDEKIEITQVYSGSVVVQATTGLTAAQIFQQFYTNYANNTVTLDANTYPIFSRTAGVFFVEQFVVGDVQSTDHFDTTCNYGSNCISWTGYNVDNPVQALTLNRCYNGTCGCAPDSNGVCQPESLPFMPQPNQICVSGGGLHFPDVCEGALSTPDSLDYIKTTIQPQYDSTESLEFRKPAINPMTGLYTNYYLLFRQRVAISGSLNVSDASDDECSLRHPNYINVFPKRRFCQNQLYTQGNDDTVVRALFGNPFDNTTSLRAFTINLPVPLKQLQQISGEEQPIAMDGYISNLYSDDPSYSINSKVWAHFEWIWNVGDVNNILLTSLTFLDSVEGAADRYFQGNKWHYHDCRTPYAYAYWDPVQQQPACACRLWYEFNPNNGKCEPGCTGPLFGSRCQFNATHTNCGYTYNGATAFTRSDTCETVCLVGYQSVNGICKYHTLVNSTSIDGAITDSGSSSSSVGAGAIVALVLSSGVVLGSLTYIGILAFQHEIPQLAMSVIRKLTKPKLQKQTYGHNTKLKLKTPAPKTHLLPPGYAPSNGRGISGI